MKGELERKGREDWRRGAEGRKSSGEMGSKWRVKGCGMNQGFWKTGFNGNIFNGAELTQSILVRKRCHKLVG